jgi:hypothetical protein
MPVLNFKPQFVPFILDGTKRHTIRATRKYPIKPGDHLFLYTGLRQKNARMLMKTSCCNAQPLNIHDQYGEPRVWLSGRMLTEPEVVQLAWDDGFRPKSEPSYEGLHLFMAFWAKRLPFKGQIIHWWYAPNVK